MNSKATAELFRFWPRKLKNDNLIINASSAPSAERRASAGARFGCLEVEDKAERLSLLIEGQGAQTPSLLGQSLTDNGLRPFEPGKNLFFPSLLKGGGNAVKLAQLASVAGSHERRRRSRSPLCIYTFRNNLSDIE